MRKFFYRVKENDCIITIAERFNASPFAIIKENRLKKEPSFGDVLFIAVGDGKTYEVTPRDTIKSVAEKFGLTYRELSAKNGDVPYVFCGMKINV